MKDYLPFVYTDGKLDWKKVVAAGLFTWAMTSLREQTKDKKVIGGINKGVDNAVGAVAKALPAQTAKTDD